MKVSDIKEIQADGHTYKIIQKRNPKCNGEPVEGYVQYEKLEIVIKSNMPESKKIQLLIHEILHIAGDDIYKFYIEERKNRLRFELFSGKTFQILKDNGLLNFS